MATATALDKLVCASYLFFLKTEPDPAIALDQYLAGYYDPRVSEDPFELGLDSESRVDSYIAKDNPARKLDIQKQLLANVISVSLANFVHPDDQPDWAKQIEFLDKCKAAMESEGIEVLGTTMVAIGNPNMATEDLDSYTAAVDEPPNHVSANLHGNIIHQFLGDLNRQFFFIEKPGAEDISEIVTVQLPRVVWIMQRLTREMAFFQDRLKTILSEKQEIDQELSQIFHQKVGLSLSDDPSRVLEDLIARLSTMYSMMATDLHLVLDAVITFDKDLMLLENQANAFGADDKNAFPRYRLKVFRDYLTELRKREADLRLSLDSTKAAIDIAQTQAGILRGTQGLALQEQTRELLNQNVILQDERASVQAAASVVELVVIFYYSLVSWKTIAPHDTVAELPSLFKFAVVGLFSISVVALTHYVGASLHKKKVKWVPVLLSSACVLLTLAAMAWLPGTVHN